jgi:fatty acid desaturase
MYWICGIKTVYTTYMVMVATCTKLNLGCGYFLVIIIIIIIAKCMLCYHKHYFGSYQYPFGIKGSSYSKLINVSYMQYIYVIVTL